MNAYDSEDDEHDPYELHRFLKMMIGIFMNSYDFEGDAHEPYEQLMGIMLFILKII